MASTWTANAYELSTSSSRLGTVLRRSTFVTIFCTPSVHDRTVEFMVSWPRRTASVILSCGLVIVLTPRLHLCVISASLRLRTKVRDSDKYPKHSATACPRARLRLPCPRARPRLHRPHWSPSRSGRPFTPRDPQTRPNRTRPWSQLIKDAVIIGLVGLGPTSFPAL